MSCAVSVGEWLGRYEGIASPSPRLELRKQNHVRTLQGSLAIEGNTLSEEQVTAILEGRRVVGPKREIIEVQNANKVYERAASFHPSKEKDFLSAHKLMMQDLVENAGRYRSSHVGVVHGRKVTHLAPPHARVPFLMGQLFSFLRKKDEIGSLLKSAVFHYEVEFIHPFSDGNGRMGRLWQHVILHRFHPLFALLPIESLIKSRQQEYYRALRTSDKAGNSTDFILFSLETILQSLEEFFDELKPERQSSSSRLEQAKKHFEKREFSRKDYLRLFKTLSSATASRDLKTGVEEKRLSRSGDKARARYRYL